MAGFPPLHPEGRLVPLETALKLKHPLRLVAPRPGGSGAVKLGTLGVDREGGVWIAPETLTARQWTTTSLSAPEGVIEIRSTRECPKVHWHRSGVVSATLTGAKVPRSTQRLSPVPSDDDGQYLYLTVIKCVDDLPGAKPKGINLAVWGDTPRWEGITVGVRWRRVRPGEVGWQSGPNSPVLSYPGTDIAQMVPLGQQGWSGYVLELRCSVQETVPGLAAGISVLAIDAAHPGRHYSLQTGGAAPVILGFPLPGLPAPDGVPRVYTPASPLKRI